MRKQPWEAVGNGQEIRKVEFKGNKTDKSISAK